MKKIKIQKDYSNAILNLAIDTLNKNKQALIFVNTKRSAEKQAEDIAKNISVKNQDEYNAIADSVLKVLPKPTRQCTRLAFCLRKGIAFHHAGLEPKQREIIETNFRNNKIKIICCTPTLAMGVDLPAFRTIIKDLRRFGQRGMRWIPVLEFLQQAGRAGRPGYEDYGEAIAIANSEKEREFIFENYINGVPEDIYSKLATEPALRRYSLSLLTTDFINSRQELIDFFGKTFYAHQFGDLERLELILDKIMQQLEDWSFIIINNDAPQTIEVTLLGRRVSQLYLDPLTAHNLLRGLSSLKAQRPAPLAMLQLLASSLEFKPLTNVKAKELDYIEERLVEAKHTLLVDVPDYHDFDYADFLASFRMALILEDWIEEKDEDYLLEYYGITPGELKAKLDLADWLIYAVSELSKLKGYKSLISELSKLRLRLKYGAKEELLPLLKVKHIGRVRARKLFRNNIKNLRDLREVDLSVLSRLVGGMTAKKIKNLLGMNEHLNNSSTKLY